MPPTDCPVVTSPEAASGRGSDRYGSGEGSAVTARSNIAKVVTQSKGKIFGECGTSDCTNTARWIPVSDIPVAQQPFIYRCPECCDRIDEERRPT